LALERSFDQCSRKRNSYSFSLFEELFVFRPGDIHGEIISDEKDENKEAKSRNAQERLEGPLRNGDRLKPLGARADSSVRTILPPRRRRSKEISHHLLTIRILENKVCFVFILLPWKGGNCDRQVFFRLDPQGVSHKGLACGDAVLPRMRAASGPGTNSAEASRGSREAQVPG
jgi:hypothetical protein